MVGRDTFDRNTHALNRFASKVPLASWALAAAGKAGPEVEKVVLLPIGKLFIDGGLSIPPRTTLRGTAQDKSTLYFMEVKKKPPSLPTFPPSLTANSCGQDGIGTQLGGLSRADGGSPTPDPAYIFGNHTSSWGVEHLSSECSNGRPQPSRHAVV